MAAQGGGQEPGKDNTYFILWLLFLIGLVCAVLWWTLHEQLKTLFIFVRIVELETVSFVVSWIPYEVIPSDWWDVAAFQAKVDYDRQFAENLSVQNLTLNQAHYISDRAGKYLFYPLSALMGSIGLFYFFTNINMRLKHKFNMRSLLEKEKKVWPQVKIASTLDILQEDLEVGPWAMAQTPMQYAKHNKLITVEFAEKKDSGFSKMKSADFKVTLDRMRAGGAFAAQLGRLWRGVDTMAPYRRAIFAIFAARGCRDTKVAQKFVHQLATSAAEGKLDCSGGDALWKKYIDDSGIKKIITAHAYEFTVFISLLMFAREDGVLPSSDFLWVKPIDRRLWYVINNVGRQTPAVEVGGIFAHWNTEAALKRPLSVPLVVDAVHALELALSEILYIPDDKEREEIIKVRTAQQKKPLSESLE